MGKCRNLDHGYEEENNDRDDESYDSFDNYETIIFTDGVYDNWVDLFEGTLSFYEWLTSHSLSHVMFKHGKLSKAKYCTQQFMMMYAKVAKRWDGMGLKLTKFHQLRHWYFYITMYGVPLNFDSSFCESHHLHLTKKTGRRTQKHQDTLAFQTATRVYEKNLMDSISQSYDSIPCSIGRRNVFLGQEDFDVNDHSVDRNHEPLRRGARFSLMFDYRYCDELLVNNPPPNIFHVFDSRASVKFRWIKKRDRARKHINRQIMEAIANKLSWFNNGMGTNRIVSVQGFTEIRLDCDNDETGRTIVRAHPARVLLMLDFNTADYTAIPETILQLFPLAPMVIERRVYEKREGIHVLIHSASAPSIEDDNDNIASRDMYPKVGHRYAMEPVFQFIKVENIKQITFVAPDPPDNLTNNHDQQRRNITQRTPSWVYEVTKVDQPSRWSSMFEQFFSKDYNSPQQDDLHLDEFNETFHPWP